MKLRANLMLVSAVFILSGCGTVMVVKAPPEARTMVRIIDIANAHKDELYIKAS